MPRRVLWAWASGHGWCRRHSRHLAVPRWKTSHDLTGTHADMLKRKLQTSRAVPQASSWALGPLGSSWSRHPVPFFGQLRRTPRLGLLSALRLALIQHPEGGESEEELRTATVQAPSAESSCKGGRSRCATTPKTEVLPASPASDDSCQCRFGSIPPG